MSAAGRSAVVLPPAHAVERAVERDLAWIAEQLGSPVAGARPVSPLRGRSQPRAALRVELADGLRVKLRRVGTPDEAEALASLLGALAPLGFPRVVARRGHALVEEWIEGRVLADAPIAGDALKAAARLLGAVHGTRPSADALLPEPRSAGAELARCDEHLAALVGAGRLSRGEADALSGALRRLVPPQPVHGITHGDFAPENLIVDAAGRLRPIDNEAVRIGVLDLDLARVWTRWPLPADRWAAFLDAYAEATGRPVADADLLGWKLRALVVAAWYRSAFGLAGAEMAAVRLREFSSERGWIASDPATGSH